MSIIYHEAKLELRGRDPRLPEIWEAYNHPLRAHIPYGRTFFIRQDLTRKGMTKLHDLEKSLKLPKGSAKEIKEKGHLELCEGDYIFSRSLHGKPDPQDDVVQAWVTGWKIITKAMAEKASSARNLCLGDPKKRSRDKPTFINGVYHGGIAFERNERAKPVKEGIRCYTIGNSYEGPTQIVAPCAPGKMLGVIDDAQLMRQNLVQAVSEISMASMLAAPPDIPQNLKLYANLINMPRIGTDGNFAYATAQLNIAPAQKDGGSSLKDAMGIFGGEHCDSKDNAGYFTHMFVDSCLPESYDPGRFFILLLGVYVTLNNCTCINFSGLRYHCGSPPTAPPGEDPAADAYRFVVVSYPPKGMTDGRARYALGALPNNETFFIPSEMTNAESLSREDRGWCTHSVFAEDGSVIMTKAQHVKWMAHAFLLVVLWFILQLPAEYGMRVDSDKFLSSISFLDDGKRKAVGPWKYGPGWRKPASEDGNNNDDIDPDSEDSCPEFIETTTTETPADFDDGKAQQIIRRIQYQAWNAHYNKYAAHIPRMVAKRMVKAVDDDVEVGGIALNGGDEVESGLSLIPESGQRRGGRPSGIGAKQKKTQVTTQKDKHGKRKRDISVNQEETDEEDSDQIPAKQTRMDRNEDFLNAVAQQPVWKSKAYIDLVEVVGPNRSQGPSSGRCSTRSTARETINKSAMEVEWREDIPISETFDDVDLEDEQTSVRNSHLITEYPYLDRLNLTNITEELDNIQTAGLAIFQLHAEDEFTAQMRMEKAYQMMKAGSMNSTALPIIADIWVAIKTLHLHEARATIAIRRERSCIMMTNYMAWHWLDAYIVNICQHILDGFRVDGGEWLSKLLRAVVQMLDLRKCVQEFNPADFSPDMPGLQISVTNRYAHLVPNTAEDHNTTISIVTGILRTWLSFPSDEFRFKAWMTRILITEIGPQILLLDQVWNIYSKVKKTSFHRPNVNIHALTFSSMEPFTKAVQLHPLANPRSEERSILKSISELVHGMCEGTLVRANRASAAEQLHLQLPPELEPVVEKRLRTFHRFIADSLDVFYGRVDNTNANKVQLAILSSPDKMLAFREHAPSRLRLRGDDGPFSPKMVRTTAGFFSALVWRGVTFATPFALQQKPIFHSLDDWCETVNQAKETTLTNSKYFCDPAAYGVTNSYRSVELVPKYWEACQQYDWPEYIGKKTVPFLSLYTWLRQGKNPPAFPHIGPLAGYLLCADYAYSGVLDKPTLEEIALVIRTINKGGCAGLELLGAIPLRTKSTSGTKRMADTKEVTTGFKKVYDLVGKILTEKEKLDVGFDVIMVEHLLCKFSRAIHKKHIV